MLCTTRYASLTKQLRTHHKVLSNFNAPLVHLTSQFAISRGINGLQSCLRMNIMDETFIFQEFFATIQHPHSIHTQALYTLRTYSLFLSQDISI